MRRDPTSGGQAIAAVLSSPLVQSARAGIQWNDQKGHVHFTRLIKRSVLFAGRIPGRNQGSLVNDRDTKWPGCLQGASNTGEAFRGIVDTGVLLDVVRTGFVHLEIT